MVECSVLPTTAAGENFAMRRIQRGWLQCEVWQRPDLSREVGAQLAAQIAGHMQRFAAEYSGLVFDLRRATLVWGPATDASIGRMLAPWEAHGKPVLVVPATEAIQQIALRRLIAVSAPRQGRMFEDFGAAIAEIERVYGAASGPRSQRGLRRPTDD